jgi:uncharacterized protein (TIGR02171 family)
MPDFQRRCNKYLHFILLLSAAIPVFYCSPNKPLTTTPDTSFHPGMKKILAAGKSFVQGANDTFASVADLEKPPMTTSFTYDYWIDTIEVTQKMFFDITGRQPVPDTSRSGIGDRFPVYLVSWYDAVLFCNDRSKKDGLDTVYTFASFSRSTGGSVYNMTGLRINYNRAGYRLPTEAEWEFAARQESSSLPYALPADSGFALATAWYAINSAHQTHPVGSLLPNSLGLHDMAGNVFEWTNDWKGPYSISKITDPLGASDPNNSFERVIKGGSFEHGFFSLRPSRRSATYPISLSTAVDFLGFRCALGIITAGNYITRDTASVRTNPVDLVLSDAKQFIGTSRARLVFVNVSGVLRTLCSVDFSSNYPFIHEFIDMDSVYVPTISPDGRFVAFATRGEGFGDPSTVYIRSLDSVSLPAWKLNADIAYDPRWWVNRAAQDTFLIYTNSSIDNASSLWRSTATFLQKMTGGKPAGNPRTLVSDGSYHDGLSSNGQYIASGYTRLLMRDIIENAERQLFLPPLNGKDASGSTQVCNVSISPDTAHPDRCLFLDFGSSSKSTLMQSSYGIHQYLFISEFSGKTVSWYDCPPGETSWDFPEWSTAPQLAVASCRSGSDDAHAVYIINLETGISVKTVQGTELDHPYLWVGEIAAFPQDLSMDSLGAYNIPLLNSWQNDFSWKMLLFWKMHRTLQIAFVGSSQVIAGIDCRQIHNFTSLNMGFAAAEITSCANIIHDYIVPQCPNIKLIAMSATPYWLGDPGGDGSNIWNGAIALSTGYAYDKNHNFWRSGLPDQFENSIVQILGPQFSFLDSMPLGFYIEDCNGWGGAVPNMGGRIDWTINDKNYIDNFNTIAQLATELATLKIHLLMINFPESPAFKNTDHYESSGPSWETGKAVMLQFQSLKNGNPYFHFYDAYLDGNHDYTDADASNSNHLCSVGAAKLSARLDSLIQTILMP